MPRPNQVMNHLVSKEGAMLYDKYKPVSACTIQTHTISNVWYQIRHHCVLTNILLLQQVVSGFFH